MSTKNLLDELAQITDNNKKVALSFLQMEEEQLNQRYAAQSWSILECIEHLNRYGDFYIPEISKQLAASAYPHDAVFRSGWLGNYFAQSMLPKQPLNKMKTFAAMNPIGSSLNHDVIHTFIQQQEQLLQLIDQARLSDLNRIKTAISISHWIRLRLGDTLRVVVYHNWRHIVQAQNIHQSEG
ncbi:MAG: DinB family protein [Saprospiraceae bacterium]